MIPAIRTSLIGVGALVVCLLAAYVCDHDENWPRRLFARLACVRPLRLDEALTGPPQRRPRRWGVQPSAAEVAPEPEVVRAVLDWAHVGPLRDVVNGTEVA